jgi:hypothetical protein
MTTERRIIGGIALFTVVIIAGGVFLFSKLNLTSGNSLAQESEIVSKTGLHWHPKLSIYINGQKQELTEAIGLGAVHQPLHTHEEDYKDGVIHMEMQGVVTKDDTKLGNFFRIWGKEFSSTQIFEHTNGDGKTVKMTVNGQENTDYENYKMRDGDIIEIRYE